MSAFTNTSRTIAIVTSVVGGLVLLGVGGTAVIAAANNLAQGRSGSGTQTADTGGVTELSVESDASDLTLRFDDVPEAVLEVRGDSRYRWSMEVDDQELVVESKQRFWDFCIGWCAAGNERVTLTLPEELDGAIDADLQVNAGRIDAAGDFGGLEIDLNAGSLMFEGSARSVGTVVGAGRADLKVDGVREADFDISAGRLNAELTGEAPRSVDLDVSAGRLELTVPDAEYDVREEVSAGSLDNRLETSSRSDREIRASVSAGSALLQPGR